MGQIYSKKYWKVPIIYAGLITSAYYTHSNFNKYNSYKTSYLNRLDGIETDEYVNSYTNDQLKTLSEFYRRNTEISALLFSLTYLLNIIDASVSAHLFEYEITKDLSLEIKPTRFYNENLNGLCLSLKLHK